MWETWKGREQERIYSKRSAVATGASLDRGLARETSGKTVTLPVPQRDKLARSSEQASVFIWKPVEQRMPRTNQHVSQLASIKRKYHQLQKTMIFPGAYEQGFAPLGFLPNWSANQSQKQNFKGLEKPWGLSFSLCLSQTLTKQTPT